MPAAATFRFDPRRAHLLDHPERYQWFPPATIARLLRLGPGSRCLDVGCGTGFFAIPFAARVGRRGVVWAVDTSAEVQAKLRKKVPKPIPPQLKVIRVDEDDSLPLADRAATTALIANVYHHLVDPPRTLADVHRVLRPGGRCLVLEWRPIWRKGPETPGPPPHRRVPPAAVARALRAAGFSQIRTSRMGPHHYVVRALR
jgi:ubiquinone/menaquinone biosynthesis C-methylase UbiE